MIVGDGIRRRPPARVRGAFRLAVLGTAVAFVTGCANSGGGVGPLPLDARGSSVILISFDALRPDVLGAYGGARAATPNIDEFARSAVVFENAYSVAPVTPTSFAAIHSGDLPTRSFQAWQFVAPTTLAELFRRAGYRTAAFVNNVQLTPQRGFGRGFDHYDWHRNDPDADVWRAAAEWLRDHPSRPLFLWVHLLRPHAPYRVHPESEHLYRAAPGRFRKTTGNEFAATDAQERARIRDLYLGEVEVADRLFGGVLADLRALGLLQGSVVVLTSDHGEELGEHGGYQHGRLYEEHLRVPLIIGIAGHRSGLRLQRTVRSVDLLPTLLRMTGQRLEAGVDGLDMFSDAPGRRPVIGVSMTGSRRQGRSISLRVGPDKLILECTPDRGRRLFDLATDPEERIDLADSRAARADELAAVLTRQLGDRPCPAIENAVAGIAPTTGLGPLDIEALRSLGYVQ